jgi:hypothetical protein
MSHDDEGGGTTLTVDTAAATTTFSAVEEIDPFSIAKSLPAHGIVVRQLIAQCVAMIKYADRCWLRFGDYQLSLRVQAETMTAAQMRVSSRRVEKTVARVSKKSAWALDNGTLRVGIIGGGRVGSALARALLLAHTNGEPIITADRLFVSTRRPEQLHALMQRGITVENNNARVVNHCHIVFLCVQPHHWRELTAELSKVTPPATLLVTLLATMPIARAQRDLLHSLVARPLVRAAVCVYTDELSDGDCFAVATDDTGGESPGDGGETGERDNNDGVGGVTARSMGASTRGRRGSVTLADMSRNERDHREDTEQMIKSATAGSTAKVTINELTPAPSDAQLNAAAEFTKQFDLSVTYCVKAALAIQTDIDIGRNMNFQQVALLCDAKQLRTDLCDELRLAMLSAPAPT